MTVEYVKQRKQFGHPVGSYQAIQHHCANMLINLDTAKFVVYEAAWLISMNKPHSKEVAMAKICASESSNEIARLGHQCHGGVGVIEDHDLPIYSRIIKQGTLIFGSTDCYAETLAQEIGIQ